MLGLTVIVCLAVGTSGYTLTAYERSFTPARNISCAQCDVYLMEDDPERTNVENAMHRRRCMDQPEQYFKPCPITNTTKPRGCGKLTTYTSEPIMGGIYREVTLLQRFCSSTTENPDKTDCTLQHSLGGYTEVCICGSDNCNRSTSIVAVTTSMLVALAWLGPYLWSL